MVSPWIYHPIFHRFNSEVLHGLHGPAAGAGEGQLLRADCADPKDPAEDDGDHDAGRGCWIIWGCFSDDEWI